MEMRCDTQNPTTTIKFAEQIRILNLIKVSTVISDKIRGEVITYRHYVFITCVLC